MGDLTPQNMQNLPTKEETQQPGMFQPLGNQVQGVQVADHDEEGPTLVDEIESLCMNCEENVRLRMSI